MVTQYKLNLGKVYAEIENSVQELNSVPLADFNKHIYRSTLISAFVKCFEFNIFINGGEVSNRSFYDTSFLRGICEDLISLKFLLKISEEQREHITSSYLGYLINTSALAQGSYFSNDRPFQPIVNLVDIEHQILLHSQALNSSWEDLGYRKDRIFPSVENMAIDVKLKDLYGFLYHATSRAVHFSPNVLLRTGWYNPSEESVIKFSASNFSEYYAFFNSHYASILFIEYIAAFKKFLSFNKALTSAARKLKDIQSQLPFFPEIVTFEELNIKRPSNLEYKVFEFASQMVGEEREEFIKSLPEILKEVKKRAGEGKTKRD